jgi:Mg2+-importing ATPase
MKKHSGTRKAEGSPFTSPACRDCLDRGNGNSFPVHGDENLTYASSTQPPESQHSRWLSWLLGIAVLFGVVIAARHFSEEKAFVRLASEAKPWWMLAALTLQAATYLAQGEIWRTVGGMAGTPLALSLVYKLALAKLFFDQALPSAGLSGSIVVAQALEDQGALPRSTVLAGALVNTTSFFIAYVTALAAAIMVLSLLGRASFVVVSASVLFIVLSAALVLGMLAFAGRDILRGGTHWFLRYRIVQNAVAAMKDADLRLVHNVRLQLIASCLQLVTFLLDAATLWMLLRSLGATARLSHVFASFMIANLVRTVSFIPGGLGTFEAAAVLMLKIDGVSVAVGLSTALLFRGLTFFLPMAPGLWFSRLINKPRFS